MANYYATTRSNYFRVKDPEKFKIETRKLPLDVIQDREDPTQFCLISTHESGWPSWIPDKADDIGDIEFSIAEFVAPHLADDEVAIFMESGSEKSRYIIGEAVAINNKGKAKYVGLGDIYKLARKLTNKPDQITMAEY